MRNARINGEARTALEARKKSGWVTPGRPQSFRHQHRPVEIAAQDEGEWDRTAKEEAERFVAKWSTAEKARAGLRHAVVYPKVTERTKDRLAQSKPVRTISLAIVGYPQVARTCTLRAFGLQLSCPLSLVLRLFCFVLCS